MLLCDLKKVGRNLYTYRKKTGMTQEEVANHAGLSSRTYADIERGSINMRVGTFLQICNALNITPNDVLVDENDMNELMQSELLERISLCVPNEKKAIYRMITVYLNSLNKTE